MLGSADGYNTEYPERLHINYTKDTYRASNKRNYVEQMALWLQCQEAIDQKSAYLAWRRHRKPTSMGAIDGSSGGGVDGTETDSLDGSDVDHPAMQELSGM